MQSRTQKGKVSQSFDQAGKQDAKSAIKNLLSARKDVSVEGKMEGRLEHAEVEALADAAHHDEAATDQSQLARGMAGRKDVDRKTGRIIESGRGDDQHLSSGQSEKANRTQQQGETRQAIRKSDAQAEQRRDDGKDPGGAKPGAGATAKQSKVHERQQSGQDNSGGQGGQQNPGAFRLPPAALMAPPGIAVPKDQPQTSRLRQLAQEIADKIVKNVRIGTNKIGLPEFQLELKSDILKGLKVKVSGRHGRIRALFSSRDPQVLKQLRGEVESLRTALTARGLKVDALEIEEERS